MGYLVFGVYLFSHLWSCVLVLHHMSISTNFLTRTTSAFIVCVKVVESTSCPRIDRVTKDTTSLCKFFENSDVPLEKKPTPLCSGPLLSHEWGKAATMTNEEYTKNEGAHIGTVSRRI